MLLKLQKISRTLLLLRPLKVVVKNTILRKMASEKITFEVLKKYFEEGEKGIAQILLEQMNNGKPQVTRNKRIWN